MKNKSNIFALKSSILEEACKVEELEYDDMEDEFDDHDEYSDDDDCCDDYDDIDDCDYDEEDLDYTAEMVVVHAKPDKYIVEYQDLARYATANNLNIEDALLDVCEANEISIGNTVLLIESKQTFMDALNEAKKDCRNCRDKATKKKKLKAINISKSSVRYFKNLKNKGIKVAKKTK